MLSSLLLDGDQRPGLQITEVIGTAATADDDEGGCRGAVLGAGPAAGVDCYVAGLGPGGEVAGTVLCCLHPASCLLLEKSTVFYSQRTQRFLGLYPSRSKVTTQPSG
jgi:hypothetical protein